MYRAGDRAPRYTPAPPRPAQAKPAAGFSSRPPGLEPGRNIGDPVGPRRRQRKSAAGAVKGPGSADGGSSPPDSGPSWARALRAAIALRCRPIRRSWRIVGAPEEFLEDPHQCWVPMDYFLPLMTAGTPAGERNLGSSRNGEGTHAGEVRRPRRTGLGPSHPSAPIPGWIGREHRSLFNCDGRRCTPMGDLGESIDAVAVPTRCASARPFEPCGRG